MSKTLTLECTAWIFKWGPQVICYIYWEEVKEKRRHPASPDLLASVLYTKYIQHLFM